MEASDAVTPGAPIVLTQQDEQYLRDRGNEFTSLVENDVNLLILHDLPLPNGLIPRRADVLLVLPEGFPDVTPDCFWCAPDITASGAPIPATEHHQVFADRVWQRWSRHFGEHWRPGIDGLRTFVSIVEDSLKRAGDVAA